MTDTLEPTDLEAARAAKLTEMGAPESAITGEERVQEDYFGFALTHRFTLSDGVSYVLHKELTEGDRKKYQKAVNRDITVNRKTEDMKLSLAPGEDRAALLDAALVGWNLKRAGNDVPFNPKTLNDFLSVANPKVIDDIVADIVMHNAWLGAETTVEDIDKELARLTELRAEKERQDAGKATST